MKGANEGELDHDVCVAIFALCICEHAFFCVVCESVCSQSLVPVKN